MNLVRVVLLLAYLLNLPVLRLDGQILAILPATAIV